MDNNSVNNLRPVHADLPGSVNETARTVEQLIELEGLGFHDLRPSEFELIAENYDRFSDDVLKNLKQSGGDNFFDKLESFKSRKLITLKDKNSDEQLGLLKEKKSLSFDYLTYDEIKCILDHPEAFSRDHYQQLVVDCQQAMSESDWQAKKGTWDGVWTESRKVSVPAAMTASGVGIIGAITAAVAAGVIAPVGLLGVIGAGLATSVLAGGATYLGVERNTRRALQKEIEDWVVQRAVTQIPGKRSA